MIGFWITCARKNRNYLPSRSWCHLLEPRRARCLFSRGRARGSRTRFFIDQAAGTPTDWYRFLWATAWKRPQKICKWAHASEISAHPAAIERSIPAEQRDSGKKFFHYMPFVVLILTPITMARATVKKCSATRGRIRSARSCRVTAHPGAKGLNRVNQIVYHWNVIFIRYSLRRCSSHAQFIA